MNWIDTAPIYGSGHSESVVGQALKALPAARRPLVFTKFGLGDDSAERRESASRQEVLNECDASLHRLGVDCIDLYQLHWPVPQPIEETATACATLLRDGKIRAIGVSNFSVAQLEEWRSTAVPLHSLQAPYSILRPAVAPSNCRGATADSVGAIAYSPLFRGMLFGTWSRTRTFERGRRARRSQGLQGSPFPATPRRHRRDHERWPRPAASARRSCVSACCFERRDLTGCIVGARDARQGAHIAELAATVNDEQVRAVDAVTAMLRQDLERSKARLRVPGFLVPRFWFYVTLNRNPNRGTRNPEPAYTSAAGCRCTRRSQNVASRATRN